ncbi:hypothetical protein FRC03_005495 [Tulasnella sp. 419]|nr:hypothetical protein FRC03_005495 [Tulasnella sp. 419]
MSGRGCYNCGGYGHRAADCPKSGTPSWQVSSHYPGAILTVERSSLPTIAITVVEKDTFPVIVMKKQNLSNAISAVRRAIFPAIAPTPTQEAVPAVIITTVVLVAQNAIVVEKQVT